MMRLVERAIALPDSTTVGLDVPDGSAEHLIRLDESIDWRFGSDEGLVDSGGGVRILADEALAIESALTRHTIYVRQTSGAPATLHWALLVPTS